MRFDHLAHVEILVFERQGQHPVAVFLLQKVDAGPHEYLFLLEFLRIVVADDIADRGFLDRAVQPYAVVEPFVSFGVLRTFGGRQQPLQFARHVERIDHLVLGVSRVDVASLNVDFGACGVEVLVFQLTLHAAVDRVGEVGAEGPDVEEIDPAAHLLVGREADTYLAVFDLGVCEQVLGGGHDFRHARLVVGTQQRRAVGMDQRVPLEELQLGEIRDPHRQLAVQCDVAAVVLLDDVGFDILAAHVGRGVHMGDEPDHRGILATRRRRDGAHHVTVLIHRDLGHAQCLHFVAQGGQQDFLFFGRRERRALLRRLGVVGDVFQESFL